MKRLLGNATNRYLQSYLLKNGKIVNSDFSFQGDVLLEAGKIAAISENLTHKTATVVDCTNKLIIPGGIDTHTHMQLPFMGSFAADDFDQGTKAAVAGGTTSFIDFAIPNKGETLSHSFDTWRGWADPKVNCDYGLHSAIV
jgi:dihydropyrimidinase